jgi:hypothetical protein
MLVYEMGKPFPHGHKGLIHDGAATQIIDKSFNVAYWSCLLDSSASTP